MARTKNRGENNAISPFAKQAPIWRLGKYLRLSKDDFKRTNASDKGKDREKLISDSIENQRKILNAFEQTSMDEFEWSEEYKDDAAIIGLTRKNPVLRAFSPCWSYSFSAPKWANSRKGGLKLGIGQAINGTCHKTASEVTVWQEQSRCPIKRAAWGNQSQRPASALASPDRVKRYS